jgi:plastocyanin
MASLLAVATALAACAAGPSPSVSWPDDAIVLTADVLRFDTDEIVLPADRPITLVLRNLERQPHNVNITTADGGQGEVVFRSELITSATGVYSVPAVEAGTYFFRCDAHPTMSGTVVVR